MSVKSDTKKIADKITILIKRTIQQKGLVDSGSLINSIKARVEFTSNSSSIKIEGNDYFKYLDGRFKITEAVFQSSEFKRIEKNIVEVYGKFIENEIDKTVKKIKQ